MTHRTIDPPVSASVEMPSVDSSTSSVSDVPLVVEQISTPSPQPLSSSPQPLLMLEDGASEPSVCVSEPVVSSDEMKILSELLPDAPEDSVHGSEDSVHSWEVARNEAASRLVVRHNIVFSDSELSVGDSPMVLSPVKGSSQANSPVAVKEVASMGSVESALTPPVEPVMKSMESVESVESMEPLKPLKPSMESVESMDPLKPLKPSMESVKPMEPLKPSMESVKPMDPLKPSMESVKPMDPLKPSMESVKPMDPLKPLKPSMESVESMEPIQSIQPSQPTHASPPPHHPTQPLSLPTPLLFTPPRPHKRTSPVIQQVTNDSPTCSPSKRISTAVSVPHTLETPKRSQRIVKTNMVSPTKVVEEIPMLPEEETKQPLSTRVRRLLTLQEEERNRFQRVMRHQTNGLYEAFQREREDGKVETMMRREM